jgi:hypothetical protein
MWMATMHTFQLSDAELAANRHLIASALAEHPVSLQFSKPTVEALAAVAVGDAPVPTVTKRDLLRLALQAIDAAEILVSRRALT